MFRIDELQDKYNMSTEEIEELLNEDCDCEPEEYAEKLMERAEQIRDERREDGINDKH